MSYISPYLVENSSLIAPSRAKSFCSVKVEKSKNGGVGVFSNEKIRKGSIVFRDGGLVVTSTEDVFRDKPYAVTIDEGLFLVPDDYENLHESSYLNHSCDSNLARIGGLIYVAKKQIGINEELTVDYAPLIADHPLRNWLLECNCGSENCRGTITSNDWKNPEIANSLWEEWLPNIQRKISGFLNE